MRRHANLFDRIASFGNLLEATRRARRGKMRRPEVAAFEHRIETEIPRLQAELLDGSYMP